MVEGFSGGRGSGGLSGQETNKLPGTSGEKIEQDSFVLRLQKLDACAVSDAAYKLKIRNCAFQRGIHSLTPLPNTKKIAGIAVTMELRPIRSGEPPQEKHLGVDAINAAQKGNIIVIKSPPIESASWGGVLSAAAVVKELAGVIIDGMVRDIGQAEELKLPIFARDSITLTARDRIEQDTVQKPIDICGSHIEPGDYIIADKDGIVVIPRLKIGDVLVEAEAIVRKEAAMVEALWVGKSPEEALGGHQNMLNNPTGE